MRWHAGWWGIVIEAENKGDRALLKLLEKHLPKKAFHYYDFGNLKSYNEPKEHGGLVSTDGYCLVFER